MTAKNKRKLFLGLLLLLFAVLVILVVFLLFGREEEVIEDGAPSYVTKMLLTKNEYSRPAETLPEVNNIVVHYVANPNTRAEANRNYFENLRKAVNNPSGVKASAHFIVGLEGEVIQCIPLTEIAYANYPRNYDTVSIEVCHPDESGKFNEVTYEALTTLTADLLKIYGLQAEDVIRHYDVSGKACPKYYVENEDAWQQFLLDVDVKLKMAD